VINQDIATDPLWSGAAEKYRTVALQHGFRSTWSVPLLSKDGQVLGTFGLYHTKANAVRADEIEVVEQAGNIALLAIERHRAQAALTNALDAVRKSESELRTMVDMIPQMIAVLAPDGHALYVNELTLEYTGLAADEARGADFRRRVFHQEDVERLKAERAGALARGEPFENEQRARGHDGQYRWFLIRYRALRDEEGRVVRWYCTATDIDDRKRSEERTRNLMQTKPSIVFVHGLWADGSCFSKVIPTLQAEGYEVMASQHSLDSVKGDVATVRRTLGRVSSPAILVGHSYGGTLITAAGTDDRVAGLVYMAALAPDENETSQSQQNQFPGTDVFSYIEVADGRVWLRPDGIGCFAGDLSEQEQKLVWATHMVPVADLFDQKVEGTAWKSKPSWYIVATKDRTVHPELERFVAKRMGATTTELDSSHVPMLSNPKLVLDVIRKAAHAVQKSAAVQTV
jgi:PAS domain S-box-containing protein